MSSRGIVLVNLGSPESPSVTDVRRYLRSFLMDERVIDSPYWARKLVVECIILPFRSQKSAGAYQKIWTPEGSPLIVISRKVRGLLQKKMPHPVALGMRYGNPSIESAIRELLARGVDRILLIPLYPQYAKSSTETAVVEVHRVLRALKARALLEVRPPFYNDPLYMDALVASARPYLDGGYDHLLLSYHGLPEHHLQNSTRETDYRYQVTETTRLFVEKAGIPKEKYSVSFQSRLGRDPWIKPYTDHEIPRLAAQGVKRLMVISPAFVTDCLETLEEIGIRGRAQFLAAGGEEFQLIPCMNDHPKWIETLHSWCR